MKARDKMKLILEKSLGVSVAHSMEQRRDGLDAVIFTIGGNYYSSYLLLEYVTEEHELNVIVYDIALHYIKCKVDKISKELKDSM